MLSINVNLCRRPLASTRERFRRVKDIHTALKLASFDFLSFFRRVAEP